MTAVDGKDLRVGDTIEVWWTPRRDTITDLRPYTGKLASLWPTGARIAGFAICATGMTIGNDEQYDLIARGAADG